MPFRHRYAGLQRSAVCRRTDHALVASALAGGKALELAGCSMVTVEEERIIHQRDYYDAGEMLYEHLPLLGWAVRGVKRRVRT